MMPVKKKLMAAIAIAGLLLSIVGVQFIEEAAAEQYIHPIYPGIELNIENNATYSFSSIPLFFSGITVPWGTVRYSNFVCYLDGKQIISSNTPLSTTLTDLSNGEHSLRVTASVSVRFNDQSSFYAKYGFLDTIHMMELTFVDTGLVNFTVKASPQQLSDIHIAMTRTIDDTTLNVSFSADKTVLSPTANVSYSGIMPLEFRILWESGAILFNVSRYWLIIDDTRQLRHQKMERARVLAQVSQALPTQKLIS
jgi:hypothetical protein